MSSGRTPSSPYKGLNAFEDTELDALLFFGRERETEIVVANLIASRLTVLYGPSGVGKSSLLSAAVARSLRALPEEPLVVVFSSWSDDPNAALAESVGETAGLDVDGSALAALTRVQAERDVYVVLDQAEEYFLYHPGDAGPGSFAEALPAVVTTLPRVNVLISLREDSLAKLDRFAGRVPGLFGNTLRLDRLDRNAARSAVLRPAERYAELTGETVTVEPELVERVLDEVGTGQIEPALGGLGAVEGGGDGARIEAPYLQLVMQRLWDEEHRSGSTTLRAKTVEALGGASHIVEEHLEGAMAELTPEQKDIAGRIFNHLVTPSGMKIAHEVSDLADFGHVSEAELTPVLSTLSERRILRSVDEGGATRFEIFHDVLAQPVLAWRTAHESERELEAQQEASDRRHRRLLAVIAGGAVLLAVMSAVTVYALSQRSEAREQAQEAHASGLVAAADAELERDPELALLLAREAGRFSADARVGSTLRRALVSSRVRRVVDVGEPVLGADFDGADLIAVTEAGSFLRVSPDGAITRRRVSGPVADVSFADDGTALVTARSGAVHAVPSRGEPRVVAKDARGAEISPDGTVAAVIVPGGVRLVSLATGRTLHEYEHPGARSAAISADNRRVATGSRDDTVRVWSGQSGRRIHTLREHAGKPVAMAFSPDGEFVATASGDGTARIWRTSDWGLNASLAGHTNALTDVSFSQDSESIVTAGKDGTARVAHVEPGDELFVLSGHGDVVQTAKFAGGAGSDVVTTGPDGSIRVWDGVYQPELAKLASVAAPVYSITAGDDDRLRVRTTDGREHLLEAGSGKELDVDEVPKRRPRRVVGPDGTAATFRGRRVRLLRDGKVTMLTGFRDDVTGVAFSPTGDLLVAASKDKTARIFEVATGEPLRKLQHNNAVRDAQFSPDGRWVLTSTVRANIWDTQDWTNLIRLKGHDGPVTAVAFSPDDRTVFTGGADGTVRTYRCELCGGLDELLAIADRRLGAVGRGLTPAERDRYLG
jgi:WD40 repeat protein